MCIRCSCETLVKAVTTYTVNVQNNIIVIKNVPCEECELCGETFFSLETSREIERLVHAAKQLSQEIAVINFSKVA